MNKEYTYIDGKVIIKDEKGNQTPVDYYDNLDEVLIQENIIETMEDKISYLENKSMQYKKYNKKRYIPILFLLSSLFIIFGPPVIMYSLGHTAVFTSIVSTIFGPMNEALLYSSLFSTLMLPFAGFIEFDMYRQHKDKLKVEKGINNELEFLKQQLGEEKEKLVNLKKEKTRTKENKEFRVVKVNDLEELKKLRDWLDIYYDLGYNEEKYHKYLENGKLEEKLKKQYTEKGIEFVKEYLEEKGPGLVKKK